MQMPPPPRAWRLLLTRKPGAASDGPSGTGTGRSSLAGQTGGRTTAARRTGTLPWRVIHKSGLSCSDEMENFRPVCMAAGKADVTTLGWDRPAEWQAAGGSSTGQDRIRAGLGVVSWLSCLAGFCSQAEDNRLAGCCDLRETWGCSKILFL